MKRLGIDFGSKKVGLATTDDGGTMAFPYSVVPNNQQFFTYLENVVCEEKIEEIIIGHSLNNDGVPNKIHQLVEELIADITLQIGLPVHLEPEQYSTAEASREQGKNEKTDAAAAAIILNSYINKLNNTNT